MNKKGRHNHDHEGSYLPYGGFYKFIPMNLSFVLWRRKALRLLWRRKILRLYDVFHTDVTHCCVLLQKRIASLWRRNTLHLL